MDKLEVLNRYFGYNSFREGQEEIIDTILSGGDVIGIMPTGAGKSVCFQVPALILGGVTIVISPLISLMKDQVNALTQCGISSAYINGSLAENEMTAVLGRAGRGEFKIIYVAPERLHARSFLSLCEKLEISMVCVDEAHCISHWGHDFRPAYLEIADFIKALPFRPVITAFTATATEQVRDDIEGLLGLKSPLRVVTGFNRENLFFEVIPSKDKLVTLKRYLDLFSGRNGIVYCSTRKTVDSLFDILTAEGYSAGKYHAGLSKSERKLNQDRFIADECEIIIATNAFGMGIDKSNVSFVIHYNMPGDIESYYQEAGRAGRDGGHADCVLIYSAEDIGMQKYFINTAWENPALSEWEAEAIKQLRFEKLDKMIYYSTRAQCLRNYILNYFGEKTEEKCGNCSGCIGTELSVDITLQAQKIFSCIKRVKEQENRKAVIGILLGKENEYILSKGYNNLKTFGIMRDTAESDIDGFIEYFISHAFIGVEENGNLFLNKKCAPVLFSGRRIRRSVGRRICTDLSKKQDKIDTVLLSRLKALRKSLSMRLGVPDYTVFTDRVINEMARRKPTDIESIRRIEGIPEYKIRRYGTAFLKEIVKHCRENVEKDGYR